jgi:hypothetical protein
MTIRLALCLVYKGTEDKIHLWTGLSDLVLLASTKSTSHHHEWGQWRCFGEIPVRTCLTFIKRHKQFIKMPQKEKYKHYYIAKEFTP